METQPSYPSSIHSKELQEDLFYMSKTLFTVTDRYTLSPPTPPPHVEDINYSNHSLSQPAAMVIVQQAIEDDPEYLSSSSLETAKLARKRETLDLDINRFPLITAENIIKLRQESKTSKNPDQKLFFVKYLLEVSQHVIPNRQNPDRAQQLKVGLEREAHCRLKKLASHKTGCPAAQLFLGECYFHGRHGLKQDQERGFFFYLQGSKLSHAQCTLRVAECYEQGKGVRRNDRYAAQFFKKAATLGDPSAMYKLGLVALNGLLKQPKSPREALSWLLRATQDKRSPDALHQLARLYENQKQPLPSIIPDLDYARELFSQAALLGYGPSQYKLGWAYEHAQLNCRRDPTRSIAWYLCAAEQGESRAELALSGWFFTGVEGIIPQLDREAYMWAKRAAEKQLADAEYAIGYYTELGFGVKCNSQEAKEWYTKASHQGDKKAAERLQVLENTLLPAVKGRPTRNKQGNPNFKNADCIVM